MPPAVVSPASTVAIAIAAALAFILAAYTGQFVHINRPSIIYMNV